MSGELKSPGCVSISVVHFMHFNFFLSFIIFIGLLGLFQLTIFEAEFRAYLKPEKKAGWRGKSGWATGLTSKPAVR